MPLNFDPELLVLLTHKKTNNLLVGRESHPEYDETAVYVHLSST